VAEKVTQKKGTTSSHPNNQRLNALFIIELKQCRYKITKITKAPAWETTLSYTEQTMPCFGLFIIPKLPKT